MSPAAANRLNNADISSIAVLLNHLLRAWVLMILHAVTLCSFTVVAR
jgi:hypothetical protein